MKVKDFIEFLNEWLGEFSYEEGLRFGFKNEKLKGICVCWMISNKVMKECLKNNLNLIISHEDLFFPPEYASQKKEKGIASKKRVAFLKKNKISFVRLHTLIDRHYVFDIFARELNLKKPLIIDGYYRVYKIENTTLGSLAETVKKKFKVSYVRIIGNENKKVKRIGILVGGLGLSINGNFIDEILSYGVDTVVAGEIDEYSMRAFQDLGIGAVEVGHEVSEEPGIKVFTKDLKEKLNIPVKYVKNSFPWRVK
ncbi:Nif3-like dinuclear metal center hexameric protein [bacterium]|nr:Nif3-like dinuclear metal center hexameric protein [bacterium]